MKRRIFCKQRVARSMPRPMSRKGVPETFDVEKNGRLRGMKIVPFTPFEVEQKLEALLTEPFLAP